MEYTANDRPMTNTTNLNNALEKASVYHPNSNP
jgi:hypothetical protein